MTNDELSAILSKHLPSTKWNLHRLIYELSNGCGWQERLDVSTLKERMRELAAAMPGILAEIEKLQEPRKEPKKDEKGDIWDDGLDFSGNV